MWNKLLILMLLASPAWAGGDGIIGDSVLTGTSDQAFEQTSILTYSSGTKHTAVAGDRVDSMYVRSFSGGGGTLKGAVYDITEGDTTRVGSAETWTINDPAEWKVIAVDIELIEDHVYAFAMGEETGSVGIARETTGGNVANLQSVSTLGATWVPNSETTIRHVGYATVKNTPIGAVTIIKKAKLGVVEVGK